MKIEYLLIVAGCLYPTHNTKVSTLARRLKMATQELEIQNQCHRTVFRLTRLAGNLVVTKLTADVPPLKPS